MDFFSKTPKQNDKVINSTQKVPKVQTNKVQHIGN